MTRDNGTFQVLPPLDPTVCQTCGRHHDPDQPHDAMRLYYQYTFYFEHGRWPRWKDAIAHCDEPTRTAWEQTLKERGVWTE